MVPFIHLLHVGLYIIGLYFRADTIHNGIISRSVSYYFYVLALYRLNHRIKLVLYFFLFFAKSNTFHSNCLRNFHRFNSGALSCSDEAPDEIERQRVRSPRAPSVVSLSKTLYRHSLVLDSYKENLPDSPSIRG